ncbi:DUF5999 family protein [Streptomyces sp. NPDC058471]
MCPHKPPCPTADSPDREAALALVSYPEQGWSINCTSSRSLGTAKETVA